MYFFDIFPVSVFSILFCLILIVYQMTDHYGRYHEHLAIWKHNSKDPVACFQNAITRRNREISETHPDRKLSTSLASANIKSIRLFRHICRLVPYLIKMHEIQHRTTNEQAKIYMSNHFRANANLTDLARIDFLVDIGYEMLYDAEWHLTHTGYLYKYFASPKGTLNDHGRDLFDDYRAEKVHRKTSASPFLKGFYKGYKSHEL